MSQFPNNPANPYQQQYAPQQQQYQQAGVMQINDPNAPLPNQQAGFMGTDRKSKAWDDGVQYFKFTERVPVQLRIFGPVRVIAQSWFTTTKGKKFPVMSIAWNAATGQYDNPGDPVMEMFDPFNNPVPEFKELSPRKSGLGHALIRGMQLSGPTDRPWRPVRLPMTVMMSLKQLSQMNKINIGGVEYTADVADDNYGRDVVIMYNSAGKTPAEKYLVQLAPQMSPLTAEERQYFGEVYNWDAIIKMPTREEVIASLNSCGYIAKRASYGQGGHEAAPMMPSMLPNVPPPPSYSSAPQPQPYISPAPAPFQVQQIAPQYAQHEVYGAPVTGQVLGQVPMPPAGQPLIPPTMNFTSPPSSYQQAPQQAPSHYAPPQMVSSQPQQQQQWQAPQQAMMQQAPGHGQPMSGLPIGNLQPVHQVMVQPIVPIAPQPATEDDIPF